MIVTHLTETIRSHAAELLTRQDVRALLDRLKETNAAVVEEVVPDALSLGEIQRVLQSLLAEGVPIRDLGTIVEAIGDKARTTRDTSLLSEYARQALGRAITAPHLDEQLRLQAITLDPAIEQEVSTSITQTTDGEYLAMDPPRAQAIVNALRAQVEHATARGCTSRAAVLGAHPPPPPPADRPGPAAPGGVLLQRDRARHRCRNDRGHPRMSTPGELLEALGREARARFGAGGTTPTRTYRGRSVDELVPQIQRELGADAIIVRRREGLTGGVFGFFQRAFVEIEAMPGAPGIDVYDEADSPAAPPAPAPARDAVAPPAVAPPSAATPVPESPLAGSPTAPRPCAPPRPHRRRSHPPRTLRRRRHSSSPPVRRASRQRQLASRRRRPPRPRRIRRRSPPPRRPRRDPRLRRRRPRPSTHAAAHRSALEAAARM